MSKKYNVSALVVSYRPNLEKLIMTVQSMILQENVSLQIVVVDDGSDEDYFKELESYFSELDFTDYILVKNPVNQGIVKNFLSGLVKCEGKYIKPISPGDYMASATVLYEWIAYMKQNDIDVCGSDYICYRNFFDCNCIDPNFSDSNISDTACSIKNVFNLKMKVTRQPLHPHVIGLSGRKLRNNYILHDDIFLGAGTLCKRKLLFKYVSLLEGKVKYAEDNCYRMMAYCGEKMGFYENETVLYEVGTGVSTSGEDKWVPLLHKDWTTTDNMMLSMEAEDKKMEESFKLFIDMKSGGEKKYLQYFKIRGLVLYKLGTKLKPRLSSGELPIDWIRRLGGDCT